MEDSNQYGQPTHLLNLILVHLEFMVDHIQRFGKHQVQHIQLEKVVLVMLVMHMLLRMQQQLHTLSHT